MAKFNHDLKIYADSFSIKHVNPFTKFSKAGFDTRVQQIKLKGKLSRDEFIVELMKTNALVGDEHSNIFPNFQATFPFEFESFAEGMVIMGSDSANQRYLTYRVLDINQRPMNSITRAFKTIIKQDNPSFFKVFQAYYFNKPDIFKGLGLIGEADNFADFTLLSPKNDTIKIRVSSVPTSPSTRWIVPAQTKTLLAFQKKDNYWYQYDEARRVLYFNFVSCEETKALPFKLFNAHLFELIRTKHPKKLVLDLRFNDGGDSDVLTPFLDSIKTSRLNNKKSFFVLLGKKVFSSSLMNAVNLKRHSNATFIGQATGGNINHFGEVKYFELPNTKVTVTYSSKYWENWKNHGGALKPDVEVSNSYFDFLRSYDQALETAIGK